MIPWIQVYSNILTHDKTYALAEALKIPNYSAVGIMVSLWAWASVNATDGDITSYPPRAIADATGWAKKPEVFYQTLLDVRLIEKDENKVVIRNWENYALLLMDLMESQKKKTNDRVKKHREKKKKQQEQAEGGQQGTEQPAECNDEGLGTCNGICNVTDTPSNALHNITLHNPTIPNLSPNGDNKNIFVVDDGDAHARERIKQIVDNFVDNRDLSMERYFGFTEETRATAQQITSEIFNRFSLRQPTSQDVQLVFLYTKSSIQLSEYQNERSPGEWKIEFPQDNIDLLCYAFEQATMAGSPGNWKYIAGIMDRLHQRKIKTLQQAEEYDFDRELGKKGRSKW